MTDVPLNREQIEEWLALSTQATPGEWVTAPEKPTVVVGPDNGQIGRFFSGHDAAFTAAARTALPRALHEVLRLWEGLEREIEALRARGYALSDGTDPAHTAIIMMRALEAFDQQSRGEIASLRRALDAGGSVLGSKP